MNPCTCAHTCLPLQGGALSLHSRSPLRGAAAVTSSAGAGRRRQLFSFISVSRRPRPRGRFTWACVPSRQQCPPVLGSTPTPGFALPSSCARIRDSLGSPRAPRIWFPLT